MSSSAGREGTGLEREDVEGQQAQVDPTERPLLSSVVTNLATLARDGALGTDRPSTNPAGATVEEERAMRNLEQLLRNNPGVNVVYNIDSWGPTKSDIINAK